MTDDAMHEKVMTIGRNEGGEMNVIADSKKERTNEWDPF